LKNNHFFNEMNNYSKTAANFSGNQAQMACFWPILGL